VKLEAAEISQTLRIEKIGAQGDGIAANIFAPLTLPGELVRGRVSQGRIEVEEILEPSPDRVPPPCPHFGDCGGCALQHWAPAPYLAWKRDQIALALSREGIVTDILEPFASAPHTRRRLALHARKEEGKVRLGFKARRTWRLVDLDICVIADPALVRAMPALRRLAAPFLEHPKSAPTLHVTRTLSGLDIDVTLAGEVVYQARQPVVRLGQATVALPPGAFLQATPESEAAMAEAVTDAVKGAARVADLFCGVGTFSFRLAETAQVYAADASAPAVRALTSATGSAPGLKSIRAEARDLGRRPMLAMEMKALDAVVFDPPRAGALEQSREIAASKVSRAVAVSCNPTTFARDAKILVEAGFQLQHVKPIDQFLWSPHIELVGVFSR